MVLLSLIAALLLVHRCLAFPLVEEKRDVDSKLLGTLNLMGQYASAAYCKSNYNSPGDSIKCKSLTCPLVEAAKASSIAEYQSVLDTDVTGYVGTDPTNHLIVVAYRGSASIENWITNFDFRAVRTDLCTGCTAHAGFWQSWVDSRNEVLAAVKQLVRANPTYKIVSTGHSLGGAVATIAAAGLRKAGYNVTLYTFGAPRVAGPELSNYITNQAGGNYRVTHLNDPVPRLPPTIFGFVHISPEYYISKANSQSVGMGDIKIFEGSNNRLGNAKWAFTDALAHLWYFNAIAGCLYVK